MAWFIIFLWSLALGATWTAYNVYCLYCNYQEARKIGIPIRIIPIDHLNRLWLLLDKKIVGLVKTLPGILGNNNFTRFNYRGWHEKDGTAAHDEMGEAFVLVTPSHNWIHLADPEAIMDLYRRGKDFPRWVEITQMLDVFGGPNIATASGEQWKKHRKILNSCLNEQCNSVVWTEAASLGEEMAHYWGSKKVFTSVGEDARTVSLHVLLKACFGQSFAFEGHDERLSTSPSASFRFSLLTVMDNALLTLALGPKFFMRPWLPLPKSWRTLGEACAKFKGHMADLYNQKLRALYKEGLAGDNTLMASLIRASQSKDGDKGLTEAEIYGTMFVVSFAGHDTTAHLLTYAIFFLAANPGIQAWLADELQQILGDRPKEEWDYHADFPRLKRCMAILHETLRVKTLVAEVKWTSAQTQSLNVSGQTLTIPPRTLIVPSYIYAHKHPRFWGPDAQEWKPERWIGQSSSNSEILLPAPSRGNHLGWSEGSRDCPAKRFSQVEWVALLASMFRDWKVEPLRHETETCEESETRVLDFIEKNTEYGGLLLQLMHPERVPLVWSRRS
ncbi:putative cytochrome P450 [Diaporthe sp. PMI_573]|nr:putative cytochrome P450 [Diaporthaceae sp. PMI_573]